MEENPSVRLTFLQKFGMLTKFMLPLVVTQMIPDIAEQVINRGITSIASDDMVRFLASYGLAFYVSKFICAFSTELRHISVVLVHNRQDNIRMVILSTVVGSLGSVFLLILGLTPAGVWLIRDVHRQSEEVTETTCQMITYLCIVPLLEAITNYFEGGLICHKLTGYAGIAKFTDFGMQVLFTIVLLFTPTRTEPVLVPTFALYAGLIGRLIMGVGFWYVLARPHLPGRQPTEIPLTYGKALWFCFPLIFMRLVQMVCRPVINLVVSRNLATKVSEEAAAEAIAVLTAVYPTNRFVMSWLNDLRTIPPTFHKVTKEHDKFGMKLLSLYAAFCTSAVGIVYLLLFHVPGVAFFIVNTIIGLNEELSALCITPLKIFGLIFFSVGVTGHMSGILIMKKKTMYLTPSTIFRLGGLILSLSVLTQTRLRGEVMAVTSLLLCYIVEMVFVVAATLFLKLKNRLQASCSGRRTGKTGRSDLRSENESGEEISKFLSEIETETYHPRLENRNLNPDGRVELCLARIEED